MKKTLSLLIITIIALTSSINANAWTDRNTFNLKGPVKQVYDNYGNAIWEFDEDGIYIKADYEESIYRDRQNRITDIHDEDGMSGKSYSYNSKGQVIKIIESAPKDHITSKYTYNSKGYIAKEHCTGEWASYTTTYTYQKFDKYGNWIKRTAKNKYGTTVETRTITYY